MVRSMGIWCRGTIGRRGSLMSFGRGIRGGSKAIGGKIRGKWSRDIKWSVRSVGKSWRCHYHQRLRNRSRC